MNSTNQLVLRIMIGIVTVMGLVSAAILLSGNGFESKTSGKLIFITLSMLIYGITAGVCFALRRKREYGVLSIIGVTISAIAFCINVVAVLAESQNTELLKAMFSFFFLAIGLAHICFLFYLNMKNKYAEIARNIAVTFIAVFTLMVVVKIFESWETWSMMRGLEKYMRFVFAALILDLTATLLVAMCNHIREHNPAELLFQSEPPKNDIHTDTPA